jgi:hypothetical protein
MPVTLNSNQINFTNNILYDGDFLAMRVVYSQVDWGICFTNGLTWAAGIPNGAGTRYGAALYVTRGVYKTGGAVDGYGTPIAGVNYPTNGSITTGYDTFTYTNTSLSRSIRILIYAGAANPISFVIDQHNSGIGAAAPLANAGRGTDDNHYTTVFRGGTPASGTSHSGGTALCTNKFGSYVAYETIPANTSYTYWHYSNISGSNADSHATRFWGEFQNFV